LERGDETAAVAAMLDGVRTGPGRGLVFEAPAGVGKTAVLTATSAAADGFRVLRAAGGEFERDLPLGIPRQLFEPALRHVDGPRRERWLGGPSAIAGHLLGVEHPNAPAYAADAAAIHHGFYWLAVAMAEEAPLALIIDDLHWADLESWRWLLFMARRLESAPIAIVAATRPRQPGQEQLLAGLAATKSVSFRRLSLLSRGATDALVRRLASAGAPAPAFQAACFELCGGNPFLLNELLAEVTRVGVPTDDEGAARLEGLVPDGLARAVLLRTHPLGDAAVALARAVALLGRQAELRHAAALAGLTVAESTTAADALARGGVLRDADPLELAHPLLQAAVLSELTVPARAALHVRAAEILANDNGPPDVVGSHLLAAPAGGRRSAVRRLLAAAAHARLQGAPDAAARFLERALREPPADDQLAEVQQALGSALCTAGDARGIDHFRSAWSLISDPVDRAGRALRMTNPSIFLGRGQEVEATLRVALVELGDRDPLLAFTLRAARAASAYAGARVDLQALVPGLLADAEEIDDAIPEARFALALVSAAALIAGFPATRVAAVARRAIGDLQAHREMAHRGFPLLPSPLALTLAEDPTPLAARFALIEEVVRERGAGALALPALWLARAEVALHTGALDAAEDHARAAVELTADAQSPLLRTQSVTVLARALQGQGEADQARRVTAAARQHDEAGIWRALLCEVRAIDALSRGDHDAARAAAHDSCEFATARGLSNPAVMRWRAIAARAARAAGDTAQASRLAEDEVAHALTFGAPGTVGAALHLRALMNDDPDELETAERTLAGSPRRLAHAEALVDLGAWWRRQGARQRAREPLAAGMELAHRCGAAPLVERARTELRAAGARPRRIVRFGVDSLTPSELRVAELAADGRTNREIAQELFVTKGTVETHLRSTFRKLDVTARADLAHSLDV
jgi:DNA-binding CsgD family transcriptional regulator